MCARGGCPKHSALKQFARVKGEPGGLISVTVTLFFGLFGVAGVINEEYAGESMQSAISAEKAAIVSDVCSFP